MEKEEVLQLIAQTSKGKAREILLQNEEIRTAVLNSGANVTIYTGKVKSGASAEEALSDVYIGLIQRKNKKGNLDGLGALGGLAERTSEIEFGKLSETERVALIDRKDDVILDGMHPILIEDIDVIRKNNVLREMREELADLGITDIKINKEKLELIPMPKVKDDNYMINIWNGEGECFAVTPYCHIYEDNVGLIDEISHRATEKKNGEAAAYRKIPLFKALSAYGNITTNNIALEDGRSADKDYRYPHEYLAAWALASKLMKHNPQRMIALTEEVQKSATHLISFERVAKATKQKMEDIAEILKIPSDTIYKMEQNCQQIYLQKNKKSKITFRG